MSLLFWNLLFLIIIPQLETDSWLEWGEHKKLCWRCNMLLKLVTFCFHAFRPSSGSICLSPLVKCHHTPSLWSLTGAVGWGDNCLTFTGLATSQMVSNIRLTNQTHQGAPHDLQFVSYLWTENAIPILLL